MTGGYRPDKRIFDHYILLIIEDRVEETINLSEKKEVFLLFPLFLKLQAYTESDSVN